MKIIVGRRLNLLGVPADRIEDLERRIVLRTMFDNIPLADTKLEWINGTSAQGDRYLEFQRRPRPMLEWFEKHMSCSD